MLLVHDAVCECFEGIMLEPCLLQPCFHVAGYDPPLGVREQLPNHRHRNLKAFEEHIQKHVSSCFVTELYLYNFSGLGVRVAWKLSLLSPAEEVQLHADADLPAT